jgi:hypothetical protein
MYGALLLPSSPIYMLRLMAALPLVLIAATTDYDIMQLILAPITYLPLLADDRHSQKCVILTYFKHVSKTAASH